MPKILAKIGDVFLIPIWDKGYAVGQVVGATELLCLAVYPTLVPEAFSEPEIVLSSQPVFLALAFDGKIYRGHWKIIGNIRDNISGMPTLYFKTGQYPDCVVRSWDDSLVRPATADEASMLSNKVYWMPKVIENAINAFHGNSSWLPNYDRMLVAYAYRSERIVNSIQ